VPSVQTANGAPISALPPGWRTIAMNVNLLNRQQQGVLSDQQRHRLFGASLRGSGSVLTDGDRVGIGRDLAQVLLEYGSPRTPLMIAAFMTKGRTVAPTPHDVSPPP
jgi:hypothetical protein